jgi:small subunit ribosomal protein S7
MPRRREVPKRKIIPDPKYQDRLVARFTNVLMRRGKRSTAESITYGAFNLVEDRAQEEALRVFKRALENVRPRVEVKSRRVGGATYQVPVEVRPDRGTSLAMRWIIRAASERGEAVKKREDAHRMADANKAFAHYRW